MQDYNTIMGVIQMHINQCSYRVIQSRYHLGSSTITLITRRFKECQLSLEELKKLEPNEVEKLFFPPSNIQRKVCAVPDFQSYYDRIHAKGSRINISYCWMEYKSAHPDGYEQSQFYENYARFVKETYGSSDVKMPVERIPGEKMYIDWVGDHPALLMEPETGEIKDVHIFVTTLGVSSLIYAEIFPNEKLSSFVEGTVGAIQFYGGVPKYLVPDNLKAAVKKHTKDELVLQI